MKLTTKEVVLEQNFTITITTTASNNHHHRRKTIRAAAALRAEPAKTHTRTFVSPLVWFSGSSTSSCMGV